MTCGFLVGSMNFCKLFCVSWEVFVLTWVGLYLSSTQVLYHNSVSMIMSRFTSFTQNFVICGYQVTKISALGTTVPARLLQEKPSFVFMQISQFRFFWKWENIYLHSVPLLLAAPKAIHGKNWEILDVLEHFHQSILPWTPVAKQAHLATHHHPPSPRRFFLIGFSISVGSRHEFPRANESSLALSLLLGAGISVSVTVSCDEDVGEVVELEELMDKTDTTNGTWFGVAMNFLAILDEMWFLATRPTETFPKFFAEFSKWENCRCISKRHCCHEKVQFTDVHRCLFFCWQVAVVCRYHRKIFRHPHGLQVRFLQGFLADLVHVCSETYHSSEGE